MKFRVLAIDDDRASLQLLEFQLKSVGYEVTTAESGNDGLDLISQNDFDVILTDLHLPDISGIGLIKRAREIAPETEIIMITGDKSKDKAIEATKAGAFWYLEKPYEEEELLELAQKAVERKRSTAEIRELRGRLTSPTSYQGIIGGSRAMQNIYAIIESVAESDANILILGESGTGKEVIANAIHYKSHRSERPFVKVNCSALPKDLVESQLFGHVKGSFTGAHADKEGFIRQAHNGSIMLDEIGEMPMDVQPKLLRVLQEKTYYRVGSDKPQEADFRLISATNRDPFEAIKEGNLREDLYYRINTIEIRIPPLRERMEDIPMLAEHFLEMYADKYNKQGIEFAQSGYDQMLNYNWRGNVRELQNVIERAVLLCRDDRIENLNIPQGEGEPIAMVDVAALAAVRSASTTVSPVSFGSTKEAVSPPMPSAYSGADVFDEVGRMIVGSLNESEDGETARDVFDAIEEAIVKAALKRTKWNKQAAANLLGVYRPRLYGMIKRHKISDDN
ncbi:sigma-54-dependent transcriptional regulator [Leptolyngbya sp. 7M]|uniref:sigma-54-dependent transcriptional regulator n=1 Tax=Leptolyngbya sp. 7M TaxID=2812896 RepID=UPI001B8C6DEA|nr:sigma-54 dependent transcriptional regulator [Leptolyngbya sp. 7M]QYO65824.1 sigma-54 dependent transcriptional regulator [Leptolyngbya sp. 7M]